MQTKVSVIIPVYNAHDYLHACLDSILGQTLQEIEVICVDDDSTDDSLDILNEYAQRDSRVTVIHQKNAGAGAARNNALQYAKGEYLSIIDADDFFASEMLAKSYSEAKKYDVDVITFACDFFDNDTQTYRPCTYSINPKILPGEKIFSAEDVSRDIFKLFVGWSWDKLFRTSFVREHNLLFQEQRTTNDMLFVFSAVLLAERITVIPDVLAHHRRGIESLSVTREKSWMCFYNALTALRETMRKTGNYERFEQDYINYCVHFSLWNLNTLLEPTHTILYNKLRDEWFRELGVTDHPSQYFYNKYEYSCFKEIMDKPVVHEPPQRKSGNVLTRAVWCIRDHGFVYTVKLFFKKVYNKLSR